MSKSEYVKRWRESTKQRIVDSMGGKCSICGYSRYNGALDLHHLLPEEKEFGIGDIRSNPKSWDKIVCELRKCVLVCSNCHSEIHAGLIVIENKQYFDETYAEYDYSTGLPLDECPVCRKLKPIKNITCSRACAGKKSRVVDWDNVNLVDLMSTMSNTQIGDYLGVSESAVRKRILKLGLK